MNPSKCRCGALPLFSKFTPGKEGWIECSAHPSRCGARTPMFSDRESAIKVWNLMQDGNVEEKFGIEISPCSCGEKVFGFCTDSVPFFDKVWIRCGKCGRKGPELSNFRKAVTRWNAMQEAAGKEAE